jgi:hypothetical protein
MFISQSVNLTFIKAQLDSYQDDIFQLGKKKRACIESTNGRFGPGVMKILQDTFSGHGEISFKSSFSDCYPSLCNFRYLVVYFNSIYCVRFPILSDEKLDISNLDISISGSQCTSNYYELQKLMNLATDAVSNLKTFKKVEALFYSEVKELKWDLENIDKEIAEVNRKIDALKTESKEIEINSLLSGEKLYFYDEKGKKLFTNTNRPEYYRWIEVTHVSPSKKTVDIRGLICEEVRNQYFINRTIEHITKSDSRIFRDKEPEIKRRTSQDNSYRLASYHFTGNDVLVEKKRIRLSTLSRYLGF